MHPEIGETIQTAAGRYTIAAILDPAGELNLFVARHDADEANPKGWSDLLVEDNASAWPLGDEDDHEKNALQFATIGGGKEGDDAATLAEAVRVGTFHIISQCREIENADKDLADWITDRACDADEWAFDTPDTFAPTSGKSEGGDLEVSWPDVRVLHEAAKNDPTSIVARTVGAFRDLGAAVSDEAVRHNLDAWLRDEKSGFRDEKNGVFLFSPCLHNPLSFRLSRLLPDNPKWQHTYAC